MTGRKANEVLPALKKWTASLDKYDKNYEHNLLEALWVSWGLNQIDQPLLKQCLKAKDHKVRAAAVNVLHYTGHQIARQTDLLKELADDPIHECDGNENDGDR